jgi:hypothetical protein
MKALLLLTGVLFFEILNAQTYAIIADRLIDGQHDQAFSNPVVIVRQNKIIDINYKNDPARMNV